MAATLIPVLVLFITAFGLFILAAIPSTGQRVIPALAWTGIVGSAMACFGLWEYRLSASGWVESDHLGQFLNLVILAGLALAMPVVMAQGKRHKLDPNRFAKLFGWVFVSASGMLLVSSTRNLAVGFVSFEILCVGAHVLSHWGRGKLFEGYFSLGNMAGSGLILLGLVSFFTALRTLDLAGMETVLVSLATPVGWAPAAGLAFLMVGFLVKLTVLVSQVAAPGQKNPGTMGILATLAQVAVIGILLRSSGWLLSLAEPATVILGAASVLGVSIGNLLGLRDGSLHRRLAFCSLAHLGYLSLGVAVGGVEARSAVLLYLLVYMLMSVGAFSVASNLEADRRAWRGLTWAHPLSGLAMSLFLLSLGAMAPTAGLVARFYLLAAAVAGDCSLLAAVSLIGSFLSAYCYMKIFFTLYKQAPTMKPGGRTSTVGAKLSLLVISFTVLLIGILPEPWLALVRRTALEFF